MMSGKRVSENDVIKFLSERREKLAAELKSIDTTIAGLRSSVDTLEDYGVAAQWQEQSHSVSEETKPAVAKVSKVEIPSKYNVSDSIDKRILFVISDLGNANRDEILKEITQKYEPDGDDAKITANVKVRLSYLLKHGVIKGKRNGRFYRYSLD